MYFNPLETAKGLSDGYIKSVLEEIDDVEHIVFDLTTCSTMTNNLDPILSPFGGSWTYTYTGYFKNKDIWKELSLTNMGTEE